MKRAIVVGSEGQDGGILCERLRREGLAVVGIDRERGWDWGSSAPVSVDIMQAGEVETAVGRLAPEEIYYLAAYHRSAEDDPGEETEVFERSYAVHVGGLIHFLQAMRQRSRGSRLFYAASSHIFGGSAPAPQEESTAFRPDCPYGITKAAGVECCRYFRRRHGLYATVGILYNHESPRRGVSFVSQKIVRGAWNIKQGRQDELVLGDLEARIDWGYAGDTVEAMVRIVRHSEPDDFVVATGETHTVREFVEIAFAQVGLDWREYVKEDRQLLTKPSSTWVGNAAKLQRATGWRPKVTFAEMVRLLVQAGEVNYRNA